jgi:hypothetical protein
MRRRRWNVYTICIYVLYIHYTLRMLMRPVACLEMIRRVTRGGQDCFWGGPRVSPGLFFTLSLRVGHLRRGQWLGGGSYRLALDDGFTASLQDANVIFGGFPRVALRLPGAIIVLSLRDGHLRCGRRHLRCGRRSREARTDVQPIPQKKTEWMGHGTFIPVLRSGDRRHSLLGGEWRGDERAIVSTRRSSSA